MTPGGIPCNRMSTILSTAVALCALALGRRRGRIAIAVAVAVAGISLEFDRCRCLAEGATATCAHSTCGVAAAGHGILCTQVSFFRIECKLNRRQNEIEFWHIARMG